MSGITKLLPKLEKLKAKEDRVSLENFRLGLMFLLSEHDRFKSLVSDTLTWEPAGTAVNRGFHDDTSDVTHPQTGAQKAVALEVMLGIIASYVPVLSRSFITEQITSLQMLWDRLRCYYKVQKTGGGAFQLLNVEIGADESYEAFYERILATTRDCFLLSSGDITHHGQKPSSDTLTPTLENVIVAVWLSKIDSRLPTWVETEFATSLQHKSLASIRELINIDALLSKGDAGTQCTINRAGGARRPQKTPRCSFCEALRRPSNHFLSECAYISEEDRAYMRRGRAAKSRVVQNPSEVCEDQPEETGEVRVQRVKMGDSPTLHAKYHGQDVSILLDTGAMADLITLEEAQRLNLPVRPTNQTASQADGTSLRVCGETHLVIRAGDHAHELTFDPLVVERLDSSMIGGVPFHGMNKLFTRIDTQLKPRIYINDCDCHSAPKFKKPPRLASVLRVSSATTILPGDSVKFALPYDFRREESVSVEPRLQSNVFSVYGNWLHPSIVSPEDGMITIQNSSVLPVSLSRSEHFCDVRKVSSKYETDNRSQMDEVPDPPVISHPSVDSIGTKFSDSIVIDPDNKLSAEIRDKLRSINRRHDAVFSDGIGRYNGKSGPICGKVVMGPTLPPQRKGRIPQYSHSDLNVLQQKFDAMEDQGVIAKPDSVGVDVEYLNPSFLVKKPSGDFRLVTAFGEVGQYSKPQPSLLPTVDNVIRAVGQWRYIIKADLSQAYYQIPMEKRSQRFLGVCTPFKGIRVYQRCGMGMPGSETALEELMSRIFGDMVAASQVAKIADDLYCGADDPKELARIWEIVLARLEENGLKLSPNKTVCCPTSAVILGWVWQAGVLSASPHRLSALQACSPPETVFGLRSFIGAFKFLSRVLPPYCDVLHQLESAVAGKESKQKLKWTEDLLKSFSNAQKLIGNAKSITIPRRQDELRIVTDAAGSCRGLSATLYVIRDGKPRLAGFFNAKLKSHQKGWLPCEVEALCIGSAVSFFSPYIINSEKRVVVLTDSKPCVQAFTKLCRGEFSSSARIMTFLSILSSYSVKVEHVPGSENLVSDFGSRHPIECADASCQVCQFIEDLQVAPVRATSVTECSRSMSMDPYLSRPAWNDLQRSCDVLRRVHAHLSQGTTISRKAKRITAADVRRYISSGVEISARDKLLVVNSASRLGAATERIVIPKAYLYGIITAVHMKMDHPSRAQLKKIMNRSFFGLNMDKAIDKICSSCEICNSLKNVPSLFVEQSTSPAPEAIGLTFSADVIRRAKQLILLLREKTTSFTATCLIKDERAVTLREALIRLLSTLRNFNGPKATIRVDPAPGFQSLEHDPTLATFGIVVELGYAKNPNKNPVSERGIQEVHAQLRRLLPRGGTVSETTLAVATMKVNTQIRNNGLSAQEMWNKRDQYTGKEIPVADLTIIKQKQADRLSAHKPSAKFRARGKTTPKYDDTITIGDLVYLYSDRSKDKQRDRYIVVELDKNVCSVKKFVGNQLRSRLYTVNLADVYKVTSTVSMNPLSETEASDDNESELDLDPVQFDNLPDNHGDNLDRSVDDDSDRLSLLNEDGEADQNVSGLHNDNENEPRQNERPRRQVRRPQRFADYYLSSDYDTDYD